MERGVDVFLLSFSAFDFDDSNCIINEHFPWKVSCYALLYLTIFLYFNHYFPFQVAISLSNFISSVS